MRFAFFPPLFSLSKIHLRKRFKLNNKFDYINSSTCQIKRIQNRNEEEKNTQQLADANQDLSTQTVTFDAGSSQPIGIVYPLSVDKRCVKQPQIINVDID